MIKNINIYYYYQYYYLSIQLYKSLLNMFNSKFFQENSHFCIEIIKLVNKYTIN